MLSQVKSRLGNLRKLKSGQVFGTGQLRKEQVGTVKIGEPGAGQGGTGQVGTGQVDTGQVCTSRFGTVQVRTGQVKTRQAGQVSKGQNGQVLLGTRVWPYSVLLVMVLLLKLFVKA